MKKKSPIRGNNVAVVGLVVSAGMKKSIIVKTEVKVRHPRYGKIMNLSRKLCVHDELGTSRVGDVVEVRQCRPISKTKAWVLEKVMKLGSFAAG